MNKAKTKKPTRGKKGKSRARRLSLRTAAVLAVVLGVWGWAGEWFVHHPRAWHAQQAERWPHAALAPLYWIGNPLADMTDGLGWTGHDAVYEYDCEAPSGSVLFAGAPQRIGSPAPADIRILDRGEFLIGWSDSLRHPVWVAYHVKAKDSFPASRLSNFTIDKSVPAAPRPDAYKGSGYDRGHMAPNYAIVTRYGEAEQRQTFKMSNVAPQSPALNRGVWREIEHRIADLWTARYGEIWVIVGCISKQPGGRRLPDSDIDVPSHFYQVILAQEGMDVRALAVLYPQNIPWSAWPARNIVTIAELERLSGLDFNPDLPGFIADPLESDLPTRLWPVKFFDVLRQFLIRYRY